MKLVFNLSSIQVSILSMANLYDTLLCDESLGREIPESVDKADMKQLKYLSDYFNSLMYNGNFSQILTTPLLSLIETKLSYVASHQQ